MKRNTSLMPSILWSRLLHELFPLLEYRHGEGNTLTLTWRHSLLSEAAKRRYLKDQEIQRDVYTHLANYFGGKFSRQEDSESGEDYNSSQDLSGACKCTYLLYHLLYIHLLCSNTTCWSTNLLQVCVVKLLVQR